MKDRKSIIVDIDGTLADLTHRLHHLNKPPGAKDVDTKEESEKVNWEAFHADCHLDEPIIPTCNLVRNLADADWCIILVTGRSADNAHATERWLDQVAYVEYDLMLMRAPGDHSPDVEIKRKWLQMMRDGRIFLPRAELPSIVIEDRARTVNMWREEGLIALQCDEGNF